MQQPGEFAILDYHIKLLVVVPNVFLVSSWLHQHRITRGEKWWQKLRYIEHGMTRLEDSLLDLAIQSLPSKSISRDAIARVLIERLFLPKDLNQLNNAFSIEEKQIVNGKILDSLFSHALREKIGNLLDTWNDAQLDYLRSISMALDSRGVNLQDPIVPAIEKYVSSYQKLLISILRVLPEEECEDIFQSIDDASAMEMVLNYGCVLETEETEEKGKKRFFLRPTLIAPQIMEAILRVCNDCYVYFKMLNRKPIRKADSKDFGECIVDLVESIVLAVKNLEIRTIYNKRVYQFSPQYDSQLGLRYLGWQAGRQESHKEIPPIRLLEKIWYLISDSVKSNRNNANSYTLNVHLIGYVRCEQLKAFSRLLYAICRDERQVFENSAKTEDKDFKDEKLSQHSYLESYIVNFIIHSKKNHLEINEGEYEILCEYPKESGASITFPSFSFTVRDGEWFNLKKAADVRNLFSNCKGINDNETDSFFILDPSSLYLLKEETEKKSRNRVLREFDNVKKYQYGEITSTIANSQNAKSDFQFLVHWLTNQCAISVLHQGIYECTADLTVLNRIRSVITNGAGSQKICYLFFTNNEAIFSSELSDLNIARLELYNGYRTGVIRIADTRCRDSRLEFNPSVGEFQIGMNLWQLLKSISSEICQYLCKYFGFDRDAASVINNLSVPVNGYSQMVFSENDKEEALVYLLRCIFVRIDYSGICGQEKPLKVQLVVNKAICDMLLNRSDDTFEGFMRRVETLTASILTPAFAPELYYDSPLDHMKRETMMRALYGRAQYVEDVMLYSIYVNNPEWLLGGKRRVIVENTIVVDGENDDAEKLYKHMKELYERSSFQPSDKSFYAYRMITGDFGTLTSLDRQLIRRVAQENDFWSPQKNENGIPSLEEEQQIALNIRRCCEELGYVNTPLYQNYTS